MQLVVGVDIGELRMDAQFAEEVQGLIAEVASVSGYEHDSHGLGPRPSSRTVHRSMRTGLSMPLAAHGSSANRRRIASSDSASTMCNVSWSPSSGPPSRMKP